MAKYKIGLENVLMGDLASDGGAGLDLTAVGDTVSGTAKMDTADPTTTDFNIEESDSPVLSITTVAGKQTATWSTYNNSADNLVRLFGGTKTAAVTGAVKTFGTITAGSGYVSGVYPDVALTGGAGTGLRADITVTAGAVTAVKLREGGQNYAVASGITTANTNLGGTGSGFAVAIGSVGATGERWDQPLTSAEKEQTVKFVLKSGGYYLIPRAKVVAKLNSSFKKDALSQIDITATILQPTKTGVAALTIVDA